MAFTIDTNIPPLVYGLGAAFSFQPAMAADSTPSPTGWTASGLPTGLAINASTGKITGAASEAGVFSVTLEATGSGPVTDEVTFQIGITDRVGYEAILGGAIEVDLEMRTGFLSVVNVTAGSAENDERGAILYAKRDDVLQIALGCVKDGELQDLIVTSADMAFKSTEPGDTVATSTGAFWKTGAYEAARYIFEVPVAGDALDALLAEEEDDDGTFVDLLAEIQVVYSWYPPGVSPDDDPAPTPRVIPRTSQEFRVRIARDWIDEE